jgi:HD-like signal output (HDOD) protein
MDLLKGLALTAYVFASFESQSVAGFSLDELQRCSVLTARVAKRFLSDPKRAEEAFTSALVHDLGKVIIAIGLPTVFAEVVRRAQETGQAFHQAEREILSVTHAEVGAYLLGLWGLPFSIVEATALHHNPGAVENGSCDVLAAVHAADALVDFYSCEAKTSSPLDAKLDLAFLDRNGLSDQLPRWQVIAEEEIRAGTRSE